MPSDSTPPAPDGVGRSNRKKLLPTCRDISELTTDLLERKLDLRSWLGVKFHLGRCQACRNYVDQMRKTVRLLRGRSLAEPAPGAAETAADLARAASQPGKPES
jgi:predicted anti-sigma-YlaC factor YlaD